MNNLFHIHLPCSDADISELERVLGVKFRWIDPQMVKSEDVKVFPTSPPTGKPFFMELKETNLCRTQKK